MDDLTTAKSSSAESIHQNSNTSTPVQPRTASIRARPTSSRITAAELEELFQRQQDDTVKTTSMMTTSHFQSGSNTMGSPAKTKVYASVAEMKRSKGKVSKPEKNHFKKIKTCKILFKKIFFSLQWKLSNYFYFSVEYTCEILKFFQKNGRTSP